MIWDIVLPSGDLAVEIKGKREPTPPSSLTVRRTLSSAYERLPGDRVGFVFLQLPEHWARQPKLPNAVQGAVKAFFQYAGTVATVFAWWEQFVPAESGGWWRTFSIQEERNPTGPDPGRVKELARLTRQADVHWIYLHRLVRGITGDM